MKYRINISINVQDIPENPREMPNTTNVQIDEQGMSTWNHQWIQDRMPQKHLWAVMRLYMRYRELVEELNHDAQASS